MVDTLESRTAAAKSRAHAESVQISVEDVIAQLQAVLGKHLLSLIVGRNVRTLQRWESEETTPSGLDERKLRNTFQVYSLLSPVEGDHTIRAWFMGMNPQLDDDSPAEAIAEERFKEVASAARAFVEGG